MYKNKAIFIKQNFTNPLYERRLKRNQSNQNNHHNEHNQNNQNNQNIKPLLIPGNINKIKTPPELLEKENNTYESINKLFCDNTISK
jgi:hypothetical protein